MPTQASSVDAYLAALAPDVRDVLTAVRAVVRKNLPAGVEEGIQYGMIGYYVPHSRYPAGYHTNPKEPLPFAALGAQKSHRALYLHMLVQSPEADAAFRTRWAKSGKRLDMGKSCVRFKALDDLALDAVAAAVSSVTVDAYIARYQANLGATKKPAAKAKSAGKARGPRGGATNS